MSGDTAGFYLTFLIIYNMQTTSNNTTDTIRNMKVGDVLTWPISKADTIRTIVWTRLLPERSRGMRWTTILDKELATLTLKRIA